VAAVPLLYPEAQTVAEMLEVAAISNCRATSAGETPVGTRVNTQCDCSRWILTPIPDPRGRGRRWTVGRGSARRRREDVLADALVTAQLLVGRPRSTPIVDPGPRRLGLGRLGFGLQVGVGNAVRHPRLVYISTDSMTCNCMQQLRVDSSTEPTGDRNRNGRPVSRTRSQHQDHHLQPTITRHGN
jgi:hypothetical protein